jgi:hypothetical protein
MHEPWGDLTTQQPEWVLARASVITTRHPICTLAASCPTLQRNAHLLVELVQRRIGLLACQVAGSAQNYQRQTLGR